MKDKVFFDQQDGAKDKSLEPTKAGQVMWGGRFTKPPHRLVAAFNASVHFDKRLALYDIAGSTAHARMLANQGIIDREDARKIIDGLAKVRDEVDAGEFVWKEELEDVHMNVEHRLTDLIGPVGGRLHTGRSRNDQVALDMHLYVREELRAISELTDKLQQVLLLCAEANIDVIIPGYTHLQRAQPVLFSHHLLAYFWMLERDKGRLDDALLRADMMPLGAGALAGTTFPIDRKQVADELGFAQIYENSMDAVSDRDYLIETLSALSIIMMHISRLSEELILWSSTEFSFVELDDAYTTGSSIMPQKKNPDVAELARGKTGRVYGHLQALLTTCKGLPLAYNKDLQEDKEGIFDAIDTVKIVLEVFGGMIETLQVRRDNVAVALEGDFSAATDMADYLVQKGVPFRQAHEIVGRIVRYCVDHQKPLVALDASELKAHSDYLDVDVLARLTPQAVVAARKSRGGTSLSAVREQLERAHKVIQD